MSSLFHGPMIGLIALTIAVWALAVFRRIAEIGARRIPVQSLATAKDTAQALQDSQAMDNFNNLLQVPVLFYVLCLALAQAGATGWFYVAGAWAYVVLRVLHSAIQITRNRVMHRFYVWMLGNLVLFTLWGVFAVSPFGVVL
jgi:hypothetical protein